MLIFGHIGLTGGIVKVWQTKTGQHVTRTSGKIAAGDDVTLHPRLPVNLWHIESVDYRLLSIGALLPDIIDKPVWFFSSGDFQWSGRGYSHTLLFSLIVFAVGWSLSAGRKQYWMLNIAIGSFFHLLFDLMWLDPTALWWPLLGPIQRGATSGWLSSLWDGLLANPYVYISEALGLMLVLYTFFRLRAAGRVRYFLRTGNIGLPKPTRETKSPDNPKVS